MSKVISFSISDRYLDKLRSLYPALTDNLAVKQFVTDGLDSNLGNSLDASLDDDLDDRVKTLIESELDDRLDERLDATVGKLISDLSERMARLEERLDDSLDGRLDDMEPLLKREKECSIATAPIPTGETSPDEPVQPALEAIKTVPKTHKDIAKLLGLKNQTTLNYWIKKGEIPAEYTDRCQFNPEKTKILWIGSPCGLQVPSP